MKIQYHEKSYRHTTRIKGELKGFFGLTVFTDINHKTDAECSKVKIPLLFSKQESLDYVEKTLYASPFVWFEYVDGVLFEVEDDTLKN